MPDNSIWGETFQEWANASYAKQAQDMSQQPESQEQARQWFCGPAAKVASLIKFVQEAKDALKSKFGYGGKMPDL